MNRSNEGHWKSVVMKTIKFWRELRNLGHALIPCGKEWFYSLHLWQNDIIFIMYNPIKLGN